MSEQWQGNFGSVRIKCENCNHHIAKATELLEASLAAEREKVVALDARRGGECDTCGGWVCPPLRCVGCMMKNRVCDSANPLPLAADVVKKLDAENATLRAERDALAERVRGLEAFIDKVFVHWSFDNDQQHTHTWHTREDLRAEYAALTPPAPQQECALCRGVGRANRCDGDTSVPVDCPKCVTPPAPAKAAREGEAQA